MFLSFLLANLLGARGVESQLLKPWPKSILLNEIVEFRPVEGHHFKLEAPQKCAGSQPLELTPRFVKCQFITSGDAEASLSVCDDKDTYCRPMKADLKVAERLAADPVRLRQNEQLNNDLKKELVPGFITGSPSEMRSQARKKGAPVLVMISTDWCPPCNEAKEYLLKSGEFEKITKTWTKIYVDGDSLSAADWESVIPFRYYPSFVLLNSHFDEIARFNEGLRTENFARWAEDNVKKMKDPIAAVRGRVMARESRSYIQTLRDLLGGVRPSAQYADEVRILRWALDREDVPVVKTLVSGKSYPELDFQILRYKLSEEKEAAARREIYVKMLEAAFDADDWAETLSAFCDEDPSACKPLIEKWPQRIEHLRRRSGLAQYERASLLGEEFLYLADVHEKLNLPGKVREFANKCIQEFQSMRSSSSLKAARGAIQNSVPCLEMAKRFTEAEGELKKLIAAYPNEPTFLLRLARVLRAQKRHAESLVWVSRALDKAYGYNWITGMVIKSDVLLDLGKKSEARAVIDEALRELRLEKDPSSRNQLVAKRLRSVATKIEGIKAN